MSYSSDSEPEYVQFPDGVYTVLTTPFNGVEIDWKSFKRSLDFQYQSNVTGLVLLGTTSETPTLDKDEQMELVRFVNRYQLDLPREKSRKFIVVGVGGNCVRSVLKNVHRFKNMADGLMVTCPHYNRPQQRGIVDMFQTVSRQTKLPIMMYNIPGRTGLNIEPETIVEIVKTCPNVNALKEASGMWDKVKEMLGLMMTSSFGGRLENFKVFSGDDKNVIPLYRDMKCNGVISVASNVIPEVICNALRYATRGEYEDAEKVTPFEFLELLFAESNPVPVKYVQWYMHLFAYDNVRRPLMELDDRILKIKLQHMYNKVSGYLT